MGGARGSGDDIDPVSWLTDTVKPGDLILTGSRDPISALMQWGTRSRSSHVAIVCSRGLAVEAYDYGLTPEECDEGVYEICYRCLVRRSDKLNRLIVRRPRDWQPESQAKLDEALDEAVADSPPFPTAGVTMAMALVALTHPKVQRLLSLGGRWLSEPIDRLLDHLVEMVADGPKRVHCSEVATRLYTRVGLELRFEDPTLGRLLFRVTAGKQADDGRLKIDRHHRDRLSLLEGTGRSATVSQRPAADKSRGIVRGVTTRWQSVGGVLVASVSAGRKRVNVRDEYAPDVADLILPADMERAEPFATEGILEKHHGRWCQVA